MTDDDDTYNGWSNRETWAIQLHLTNNEGDYLQMREKAQEMCKAYLPSEERGTSAVGAMALYIKEWTEDVFTDVLHSDRKSARFAYATEEARMFVADVGSWWRADFYEIAQHWIDEAREESKS